MIAVVINPIAGGARPERAAQRVAVATDVLRSCNEAAEVFVTERKGHARELAARAIEGGARLVIAWGGDGTLNEVGSALIFGQTPLALVPSGSGNGLARELGVSQDAERAIREAVRARPRVIDAGELAGRFFFNIAGIGFDAHVAACLDREAGGRRGFSAYARITAREVRRYRAGEYRIDEEPAVRRAFLVTLANSPQFGNGARIAPKAKLDDGRLDLVVFEPASWFGIVCAIPRLFTGGVTKLRQVTSRQFEQLTVTSGTPMTFHVDGEPVQGGTQLEARVHPAALRICVS